MNASGGACFHAGAGKMFGVAERRRVFAQPGEAGAGRGGFEREALAQDASKARLGAIVARSQNLVEGEKTGAGEEGRRGSVAGCRVEPRPTRQRLNFLHILRKRRP